jgi:HSP20 family protein
VRENKPGGNMYNLELRPSRRHLLGQDFDRFFDSLHAKTQDATYTPSCEILDEEKRYSVSLDIPGLKKEDINLEVKDNQLIVTGERKKGEQQIVRSEKVYGKFTRIFTLPQDVNADGILAKFEYGVLEISLPKEDKAPTRKINITE